MLLSSRQLMRVAAESKLSLAMKQQPPGASAEVASEAFETFKNMVTNAADGLKEAATEILGATLGKEDRSFLCSSIYF